MSKHLDKLKQLQLKGDIDICKLDIVWIGVKGEPTMRKVGSVERVLMLLELLDSEEPPAGEQR